MGLTLFLTGCYGVEADNTQPGQHWQCTRCRETAVNAVSLAFSSDQFTGASLSLQECCLCVLRGGALKPTSTGRWAHLVCAVSIPEVLLEDSTRKEPVLASSIPRSRKKLVGVAVDGVLSSLPSFPEVLHVHACASQHDPWSGRVCAVCEGSLLLGLPRHLCPVQRSADRGVWGAKWPGLPQALPGRGWLPPSAACGHCE